MLLFSQQCTLVAKAANCIAHCCESIASKLKEAIILSLQLLCDCIWSTVCNFAFPNTRNKVMYWNESNRDGLETFRT